VKVVCAGQQVNRIDLGSVDVGLVAALCCCTGLLTGWSRSGSWIASETYKDLIDVSALVNRGTIRENGVKFYEYFTFWVSYSGSRERAAKSRAGQLSLVASVSLCSP